LIVEVEKLKHKTVRLTGCGSKGHLE